MHDAKVLCLVLPLLLLFRRPRRTGCAIELDKIALGPWGGGDRCGLAEGFDEEGEGDDEDEHAGAADEGEVVAVLLRTPAELVAGIHFEANALIRRRLE